MFTAKSLTGGDLVEGTEVYPVFQDDGVIYLDKEPCYLDSIRMPAERNHAAALLHRVRAQRDAERKWREAWKASSDLLSVERAQLRKQLAAKETKLELTALALETTKQMYEATRAELTQADAARVVAEQVAEREHARAEREAATCEDWRVMLENVLLYAPTPADPFSLYSVWHGKARRLLAAHKAQERA